MKLPHITYRQKDILDKLYHYRFLTRQQIQTLMGHRDKRRISAWLLDLRTKGYIYWNYDPTDFYAKTQPAVYYLGLNGVRHFLEQAHEDAYDDYYYYAIPEVRKRYREASRSQAFIDRCLLLADCRIALDHPPDEQQRYRYETELDYQRWGRFKPILDSELIRPQLCFDRIHHEPGSKPTRTQTYFLEIFDSHYPRYRMAKRIRNYLEYLYDRFWEDDLKCNLPPVVLLVCPTKADLIYTKRLARRLLTDNYLQAADTPDDERVHIRFTTADQLRSQNILADVWETA